VKKTIYSKYLKYDPFPYQKEGIQFGIAHNYCVLGDAMGLGKTFQAIGIAAMTKRERVLVACPAFLKLNWEDEFNKFLVNPNQFEYKIISYTKAKDSEELFKWADCLILDEIHYIKNKDAARTKATHQYVYDHRPARVIGLSGTAITGKVPDWYSLIMLMSYNPFRNNGLGIDNVSYWDFCQKFCNVKYKKIRGRKIPEYYGTKNVQGLKRLLKDKYLRRRCEDVLDLGEIIEQTITITQEKLDDELLEELKDAERERVWATIKKKSAIVKSTYCVDFVDDLIGSGGPVVVFSDHRIPVDNIFEGLTKKKRRVKVINGDVDMDERHKIVKLYMDGRLDAIVGTIDSMAVGFNITRGHQVVFNDLSAKAHQNAQALKRVHRIGQEKIVKAYYLSSNKIDKEMTYNLRQKAKTMRETL
jgi:SWI/SNF-related matrix-associated actin-dependent regulator 1 of chromatin subfamily A